MICLIDRFRWALAVLVLASAIGFAPAPAHAQYALFFESFGDWTVTCERSLTTQETSCKMSAPQAVLDQSSTRRSVITVREPLDGFFELHIQLRGPPDPGFPLEVIISSLSTGEVQPDRFGDKTWVGSEAKPMVEAMRVSEAFVLKRRGRVETVPLSGFGQALARLKERNRALGLIQQTQ